MSVRQLCEAILRNTNSVMTVSSLITGQYGIQDVCLSLPFILNSQGIRKGLEPRCWRRNAASFSTAPPC